MDLTLDACTNLFTEGQKERMRATFETGGGRKSILSSTGLLPPLFSEIPAEEPPAWFQPQLYPNPATSELTLDVAYDIRWIGKTVRITSIQGQQLIQTTLSSKSQKIDISQLKPGMYILSGKKEDGSVIKQKFIKL